MPKKKSTRGGARPGAGRPKIYEDLAAPTSIALESKLMDRLDAKAKSLGLTRSAAVQQAVTEWLEK
jgi:hypothetical protein